MRAVRYHEYGGVDVLGVDEVEHPTPDDDEVLVEIRAASVNRVDLLLRSGEYGHSPLPSTLGGDGAGVVVDAGSAVDQFKTSDRVFISGMNHADGGTFAEYAAVPTMKLAPLPDDVSFEEGAAVGNVGATAWTALEEVAGIESDDSVLIHGGAGGVGHLAVQIAANRGGDVIATAGSDTAREKVRELGATTALDYESESLVEDVMAETDEAGVDIVLDHRLQEYLDTDLQVTASGGEIVSIMGHFPETNAMPFYNKELSITGLKMGARPVRAPTLERLANQLAEGTLTGVVAETYDFDSVAQAHRDALAGGYVGKLVVTP